MLKKTGNILIFLILFATPGYCDKTTVKLKAFVEPGTVQIYERLYYRITVESNAKSVPDPVFPEIEAFKIEGTPASSSQMSWINGRVSSEKQFTITLKAQKAGKFVIPPATVRVGNQVFKSNSVSVLVKKPSDAEIAINKNNLGIPAERVGDLFVWSTLSESNPYVGQPIELSCSLFTRLEVVDYGLQEEPDFSGFWVEDLPMPNQPIVTKIVIGGKQYARAVVYKKLIYPTVSGELILDPVSVVFKIRNKDRDPFGSGFGSRNMRSMFQSSRREIRSSQAVRLNVKSLPEQGKPAGFSGAIGQFTLKDKLNTETLKVGEALELAVTLSGNHGLSTLQPPVLEEPDSFKMFDPKSGDIREHPQKAGWRTRQFDYILVPHVPGEFIIPSVTFSFFDPGKGKYRRIQTASHKVLVEDDPLARNVTYLPSENGEDLELLGVDVRYIKTSANIKPWHPLYLQPAYLTFLALHVLVIPFLIWLASRRRKLSEDLGYARSLRAKSQITQRFKGVRIALKEGNLNEALDQLASGYAGYFGDRLNLPSGGLTSQRIRTDLKDIGVADKMAQQVFEFWETLEIARFAPGSIDAVEVEKMLDQAIGIADAFDKLKIRGRKLRRSGR